MNSIDTSSITDYLATLDPMRTAGLIIGLFVGFVALYLLLHYSTRKGRARAREAARAWSGARAVEWRALAEVRADRIRARATSDGRRARTARIALALGGGMVAIIAIAGTNLSAHGIQAPLGDVGLGNIDARVSVFIVFEGVLMVAAGLSFWHQVTGRAGVDRYALGMWGMSLFMAFLAAWGGDHWVYAPFPIIAAVAFHELTAAEAKRRGKYRGILGRGATSQDATEVDTERRINAIVTYGTRANGLGIKGTRWFWVILHARADRAADARGILTDEVRAVILERSAARYVGARALSPEAVAAHNPWERAHARALTVPDDARVLAPEAVPAPEPVEAPAPVPDTAHMFTAARERALELDAHTTDARAELHVVADGPLDDAEADALIAQHCKGGDKVRTWVREFWGRTRQWPTGRQLADEFGGDAGNCRKWVADLKKATAQRAA